MDRPQDETLSYAECIAGKFRCPPEDVGAIHGFKEFLASMMDPDHPEREENLSWFDKKYDFTAIDLRSINYRLKNLYKFIDGIEQ